MADRPTSRDQHQAHEDERNRLHQLARREQAVLLHATLRVIGPLLQPHEPHLFHAPAVAPVSPRRAWDMPAAPGGTDHTGFSNGVC